ncbi:TrmH family RNA methyltransferase [Carnobacterium gallinarum]|uniref:TrmH family RNA methyltransferase n=1 Tax=Carnobacterium gallinarum TaxID=2749 RepID=UPI00055562E2|nr:RNA methyltransferase [Carnobacterium gallinarum]
METILSTKNDRVKQWKKLQTKKGREKSGTYLIEGYHLLDEALKNQATLLAVIISEENQSNKLLLNEDIPQFMISTEIAKQLSETETSQGIFAVIKMVSLTKENLDLTKPYLFLDNVQDPGNVGTMIRTADAAGFGGIVLGKGSVDLYNSKVLRSMQGSHFHLPIFQEDLTDWFALFKEHQIPVYGTELNEAAASYQTISPMDRFALVMGNEGNGMSESLLKATTKNLYIPIAGQAESLNVAVAAGILMFSLKR